MELPPQKFSCWSTTAENQGPKEPVLLGSGWAAGGSEGESFQSAVKADYLSSSDKIPLSLSLSH